MPLGSLEFASRRNDPHVAVAWSSTLFRNELFQAGHVGPFVIVHVYEGRAQPLNSVSTNALAASTAAQYELEVVGAEAIAHAGLGHQVRGILRIALDLAPQPRDVHV